MPRTPKRAGREPAKGSSYLSEIVALNIATFRQERGLTQAELAERVDALGLVDEWKQTTVSKIEKGDRNATVDEVAALALALGVPFPSLFDPGGDGTRRTRLDYGNPKGGIPARDAARWVWGDVVMELRPLADGRRSFRSFTPLKRWYLK